MALYSAPTSLDKSGIPQSPTAPPEEQAGPSGVPPPRKRKRQAPREEAVCGLCRRGDCDPEIFGQLCRQNRLLIHENCLYHASRLMQRGADEEGFYGFLFPDIRQELKRVAQKRCCICRLQGASVTCKSRRCRRTFHFPCGSERGCISQFFGEFKSLCWKHRPVQRVRAVQHGQTPCLICLEAVAGRPTYDTLVCPACASAWFHRRCIQGQALRSALHYFCCPLCRDMATFQAEMFRLGIKIPDRDAAWEEEDGAFAEHYERHGSCDAGLCLCPAGREQAEVNGLTWKSSDPVWVEQWPLSKPRMDALLELIDRELQRGHIEPSTSPWNTPVFVIPKRSGEGFRLLHDLRKVNEKIQPMGPVQTLLPMNSMIPEGQPCAVLDIKDCFFSIPLHEEDRERFAFSVVFPNSQRPNLRFQWKVLPQGMINSPTICQITVDRALAPVRHSDPTATIIQYMDDILIAAPSGSQVDQLVSTVSDTLKTNGFEIATAKIKRGPCVSFLGINITSSYITPPQMKIRRNIKTLHDMQQLVGSLQWLRNIVLVPPETMSPLYDLLKGKNPWEQKTLTTEAMSSLDFIEQQISSSSLARWKPNVSLDLYVHFTTGGGVGALAQGPPEKAQPIQWVVLGKPSRAFSPGIECLGNLIMKGRKLALRHLGIEPATIYLPFRKQLPTQSVAMSEHLAVALVGFGGEVRHARKPPWTQMLKIVDIDLPQKVMDRPQPGPTVFTDASSVTSTAAAVWQSEGEWHRIKMTDRALSVQQLEAAAVVLACGLFPMEHLNIVTDSMFVAKLCLAMSGPGVSTSTIALMLEEALFSRKGTISVIHVNSHDPIKGFFQTGNDKADAAAKGLWTLRDARQLHESLHIGAKALAKRCGISATDAKHIVATCPHCQKTPLWSSGVNPRGLKASEVWQTDFTFCQLLKPRAWLAVTVDTYSGMIVATQHLKTDSKATIQHWLTAMAWLGVPNQIKTDNGPNFDRIIGRPRNPYTPVAKEDDKLTSTPSEPGNSALGETKQRQNSPRRGGPRCLCVILILELVTIEQVVTPTTGDTWLLRCWDNGASSLELEGREAKQLGSLSREGGIDKAIGKKAQALSLWRRLLSSVRERYPFSEDVVCRPGKWTTMERGIQYLRELAVRDMVYYDPDNAQLPTDPDEVQCTRPMWRKFVRSAPSSYANSLAVIDWKSEEAPTVDEVAGRLRQYEESLSSSLVSAVEKLSQDIRQLKEDISYSPPVQTRIAAVRSKRFSAPERGYRAYTPRDILWFYLRDHGEDMRKWDGKPTSTLRARVHELQGKTAVKRDSSRKDAAPVSTWQPPRPSERTDRTYDPLEGTSKSFLQEVNSDYDEQD
ncbi:PHD finger protein 7-like [Grus japonensis]|uniref:PHD finger protein 7-like n=1 Tax=Grus japonensis TaxID=30415 RepID=A0ABC9YG53_GRUJA